MLLRTYTVSLTCAAAAGVCARPYCKVPTAMNVGAFSISTRKVKEFLVGLGMCEQSTQAHNKPLTADVLVCV